MQMWKPDTCRCIVNEEVHADGTKTLHSIVKKCADHASVADADLYGVLYANADGENKRKNLVERLLVGADGTDFGLHDVVTNPDGSQSYKWKNGITFSWAWSGSGPSRVLTVAITGRTLTTAQRNIATTWLANRFGAGKVVLA